MRILLGTDGSEHATIARDAVREIPWPRGSTIRLVTAVRPVDVVYGVPWAVSFTSELKVLQADLQAQAESILEEAARGLGSTGLKLEREVLHGRPASCIVADARQFGADLIVLGSRGHGRILSMLLGSVAAEVTDQAHCPVLIARRPVMTRAVLAHDGSDHARAAEDLVAGWPIFADVAVEVTTVAETSSVGHLVTSPELYASTLHGNLEASRALRRHYGQVAESAAERLRRAGRRASDVLVEGDPAAAILRVAEEHQADLIVLGTHGRTGLERLMLGSVARKLMQHSPLSVLIVRTTETG